MADYPGKGEVPLTSVVHCEQLKPSEPAPPYVSSVELVSSTPQPRDHVLWSLFNSMFLNFCCLGFLALVFSFKARDRKILRDLDGAGHYASTAKVLNIISTTLGLIATIACIAYMIIVRFGVVG